MKLYHIGTPPESYPEQFEIQTDSDGSYYANMVRVTGPDSYWIGDEDDAGLEPADETFMWLAGATCGWEAQTNCGSGPQIKTGLEPGPQFAEINMVQFAQSSDEQWVVLDSGHSLPQWPL